MKTKELTKEEMATMFDTLFDQKFPVEMRGTYFKVNGEKRLFRGTLNYADENVKGVGISNTEVFERHQTVSYYDAAQNDWRRFKLENLDWFQLIDGKYLFKAKDD